MNLFENINRIQSIMGLTESELPIQIRRRINYSEDEVIKELKSGILRFYRPDKTKLQILSKALSEVTRGLIFSTNVLGLSNEEDFQQMVEPIFDFLYKRFKGVLNNFYDSNFSDDDNLTYCFKKHKDLNPFGSRGFTSCVEGWNKMLAEYGYWLPDVNWPEVKEKLKQYPSDKNLLLAKPLQGHNYEYYFSISRK